MGTLPLREIQVLTTMSQFIQSLLCFFLIGSIGLSAESRILIVVGPSNHPPGSHEVAAGSRLLQHFLRESNVDGLHVDVAYE